MRGTGIRAGIVLALLWALLSPVMAHTLPGDPEWRLVTDRDGVRVYMAHSDDSPIKTFRGETVVLMSDFRAIGHQLNDYEYVTGWMHMISSIEDIHRASDTEWQLWVTTRLPWPVSNRDAALDLALTQDPETYAVIVSYGDNTSLLPPQSGYVRMPDLHGRLQFTPLEPGRVHVSFEVVLDPGGYIPNWIANLILRDIPYFSLRRYQRVADQKRFKDKEVSTYRVPPGWPGATEQLP